MLADEVTERRITRTDAETEQATLTLILQSIGRAADGMIGWADALNHGSGAYRPGASAKTDAIAQATDMLGAPPNASALTLADALGRLVSVWSLILDFLIGMAERLLSGPECNGAVGAAALAMTQRVRVSAITPATAQ